VAGRGRERPGEAGRGRERPGSIRGAGGEGFDLGFSSQTALDAFRRAV